MELIVSCCGWGNRKASEGISGIYKIDFDRGAIVQQLELPILFSRGCSGMTWDSDRLYLVRPRDAQEDELLILDRQSWRHLETRPLPGCFDTHQIDYYQDRLWITNTNFHELVVMDVAGTRPLQRLRLFPDDAEERSLKSVQLASTEGDHRLRPHINSIQVRKHEVQLGLFGARHGNFHSAQLLRIPWTVRDNAVEFGPPVYESGGFLSYPHNALRLPTGEFLGCSSATGEIVVGDRRLAVGGWPRGIAIDERHFYIGISSHSHGFALPEGHSGQEESAGIVRVDRSRLQITGEFSFHRQGQIYDVRNSHARDFGMSQFAEFCLAATTAEAA